MKQSSDRNSRIVVYALVIVISSLLAYPLSVVFFKIPVVVWDVFITAAGIYCAITMFVFKIPAWERYRRSDSGRLFPIKKANIFESICYIIYLISLTFTPGILRGLAYSVGPFVIVVVLTFLSLFTRQR